MSSSMTVLCVQFGTLLSHLVSKFEATAATYSAVSLKASSLQAVKSGSEQISKLCSIRCLLDGGLMLRPFNRNHTKRIAVAVGSADPRYCVECRSSGVVVRLPKLTAQRRQLVLAQLEAALEGAKTEIRLRRRSMVGRVRTA
ncbi:MAG: ribosome recycling factor, partial [Candidatus Hodgkinia cicadicola]